MYYNWRSMRTLISDVSYFYLDIEVACYGYEGVDAVKAALKEGLKMSTDEMPVKVIFR